MEVLLNLIGFLCVHLQASPVTRVVGLPLPYVIAACTWTIILTTRYFSHHTTLTGCFYYCPSVSMQQLVSWCQKVVSMRLSLLADNLDALSLSFEECESAIPCSLRSLAHSACPCTCGKNSSSGGSGSSSSSRTQALDMSTVWNMQGVKRQAFLNCASHFCRTRCPAHPGPRPPGCAGRRDGWTCALFLFFTHACRSTCQALTPAGELRDFVLKGQVADSSQLQS